MAHKDLRKCADLAKAISRKPLAHQTFTNLSQIWEFAGNHLSVTTPLLDRAPRIRPGVFAATTASNCSLHQNTQANPRGEAAAHCRETPGRPWLRRYA